MLNLKRSLLFFSFFRILSTKEVTFFYLNNFYENYSNNEIVNRKLGRVSAFKTKIDELKLKYPNSIKIYIGSKEIIKEKREYEKYIKVLEDFNFDVLGLDINQTKNEINNLPIISCNLFERKEKFLSKYERYKNFYIDNIRISIIGLSDISFMNGSKFEERDENIKIKEPLISLNRTLEILRRNFNPHLFIIVSTYNNERIIKALEKNKNAILILENSNQLRKKFKNIYMLSKNIKHYEIGKIDIKMEGEEIIDYKVQIIPIVVNENIKDESKKTEEIKDEWASEVGENI